MKYKLIERVIERDGEKVIEGRSRSGKLLVVKTQEGYELRCPRLKEIYLITYEEMVKDSKGIGQMKNGKGSKQENLGAGKFVGTSPSLI